MPNKILVIDDHPVIIAAIKAFLDNASDLSIVDVSYDGCDGLEKIKRHQPDLVILDLFLPKTDGLSMIRRIKAINEKIKVLVLTGNDNCLYATKAAAEGANGFITKSKDIIELVNVIRMTLAGYDCFPTENLVAERGLNNHMTVQEGLKSLTARELAIMRYLAKGYSNKEIAKMFFISDKTVSTYKQKVLAKLHLKNVVAIAEYARDMGVV